MPTLSQAHAIVSREGWLSFAPPPFRQTVLALCKLEALKAGGTIYSVGDPPGGMFGLVRGSFALSIAPGERGPYVAHFARPSTWFGEAAAFTEQPRRISLAVTRELEILAFASARHPRGRDGRPGRLAIFRPRGHRSQ